MVFSLRLSLDCCGRTCAIAHVPIESWWELLCELTSLHDLTVAPDSLQIVKQAILLIEYMHDDIAVVHEDPVRALVSLYLLARVSGFAKLLFHIVGHSLNLVSVGTTRDEEVISQNGYLADVDHADIFAFLSSRAVMASFTISFA